MREFISGNIPKALWGIKTRSRRPTGRLPPSEGSTVEISLKPCGALRHGAASAICRVDPANTCSVEISLKPCGALRHIDFPAAYYEDLALFKVEISLKPCGALGGVNAPDEYARRTYGTYCGNIPKALWGIGG